MKVCEKVESKQCTTYNEVADELVAELPLTMNAGVLLLFKWPLADCHQNVSCWDAGCARIPVSSS